MSFRAAFFFSSFLVFLRAIVVAFSFTSAFSQPVGLISAERLRWCDTNNNTAICMFLLAAAIFACFQRYEDGTLFTNLLLFALSK